MPQLVALLLSVTSLVTVSHQGLVSEECLECLCELISRCDIHRGCEFGDCGPFGITMSFWLESRGLTSLNGLEEDKASILRAEYERCSTDLICATKTMQKYAELYKRDCNRDGVFNCLDYAAIHYQGPVGCLVKHFPVKFTRFMERCLKNTTPGAYTVAMDELIEREKQQNNGTDKTLK